MHNKTYPKDSITRGYIAEECLTFCSRYFKSVETIFNLSVRNVEESMGAVVSITLEIGRASCRERVLVAV